jgi:hypothetical protein
MSGKICKRTVKKTTLSLKTGDAEACRTLLESPSSLLSTTGFDVEFSPRRRLVLSCYMGQILIHIREYDAIGEKEYPTKKGACFTPGRFRALREKLETIDEMLRQQEINASFNVTIGEAELYKVHLGAGIYASIAERYHGVSLRRHWMPPGQESIVPTKNGIFIPVKQWASLKIKIDELLTAYPGLNNATVCIDSHDGNQVGFLECHECLPFGRLQ